MTQEAREQGEGVGRISNRAAAWFAWTLCTLTVALVALVVGFTILTRTGPRDFTFLLSLISTATLALVYVGSVVVLQGAFRVLTGQESQLAVVASTLAIAAMFNPLRRRVQAFVARRFFRRKYDAAQILTAFSTKLKDETDLGALNNELVGVVRETMQPAHVSLWLRPDTPREGEQLQ